MRLFSIILSGLLLVALLNVTSTSSAQTDNDGWVKYASWKGQVDNLLILKFFNDQVKSVYPVSFGYKNSSYEFFAEYPDSTAAAKIELKQGRGKIWVKKQYWHSPDRSIQVQIFDKQEGWGDYEFILYYKVSDLSSIEKNKYQDQVNDAVLAFDFYQLDNARAREDYFDALRWAKSAYEINRLNWDILNIIGELYYLNEMKDQAVDVYIVLRDNGYLTEENMKRFEELNPYEANKKKPGEEESKEEEKDESEGESKPE